MRPRYVAKLAIGFTLIVGTLFAISCATKLETATHTIKDVSPTEASQLIQENHNNPDFVVIDVRTPEEFAGGYIDDAININFNSSNFRNEISELERGYTYLIYCRSGNRSRGALDVMVELDFRTVYHLSAGITGWFNGGLPLTK